MANIKKSTVKSSVQISLIRTPPEMVYWSDKKIKSHYKFLISLEASEEKDLALRQFDFFSKLRGSQSNRNG